MNFTGAAFEPDMNHDVIPSDEGPMFEEEPRHAFPLPVRGLGILPEAWKVTGQVGDSGALMFIHHRPVLLALLLVPLLCLG